MCDSLTDDYTKTSFATKELKSNLESVADGCRERLQIKRHHERHHGTEVVFLIAWLFLHFIIYFSI